MMKASMGRVEITPEMGFPIGGNVRSDRAARGVHDPLHCNILLLRQGTRSVCLLGFDLVGLHGSQAETIRKEVRKAWVENGDSILMFCTHTHSGPDTVMSTSPRLRPLADAYVDSIVPIIAGEVGRLKDAMCPVVLKAGRTKVHGLGHNRRLVKNDGSIVMNFETFRREEITGPDGPVDPDLSTLSVWDKEGRLLGVLVNFTLHPAVLVGYRKLISRDYVHALDETILKAFGPGTVVLFANGAAGNVNHLNYMIDNQKRGFSETRRIGSLLGRAVLKNIRGSEAVEGDLRFVRHRFSLPLREITPEELEWAGMVMERDRGEPEDQLDGIPDMTYARCILGMSLREEKSIETMVMGLKIGEFQAVTLPGEVFCEIALELKNHMNARYPAVISLSGDYVGYIPVPKAFDKGGYETKTLWTSQLARNAADVLVKTIKEEIIHVLEEKQD
ncbi:MAG: hypothetical protein R6W96_02210 [Clostridia bacterium]